MCISRYFGDFYERFISLKGEPRAIAAGMALGVFVGVTPTIPFHTGIIVALGLVFRQNITAACLGSWIVSNPLTVPLLYFSEYQLGRRVLGMDADVWVINEHSLQALAALGWEVVVPLLAGGLILAPLFAVAAYGLTHRLLTRLRGEVIR
jgi:hypothetical protein